MTPGAVLDVGAAGDFVLQGLFDCGWEGTRPEPNASMVVYVCDYEGTPVATHGDDGMFEFGLGRHVNVLDADGACRTGDHRAEGAPSASELST